MSDGVKVDKELPPRRPAISQATPDGHFLVTMGMDPRTGQPCELFFANLRSFDSDLDDTLIALGRCASKLIQAHST